MKIEFGQSLYTKTSKGWRRTYHHTNREATINNLAMELREVFLYKIQPTNVSYKVIDGMDVITIAYLNGYGEEYFKAVFIVESTLQNLLREGVYA